MPFIFFVKCSRFPVPISADADRLHPPHAESAAEEGDSDLQFAVQRRLEKLTIFAHTSIRAIFRFGDKTIHRVGMALMTLIQN